MSRRRDKELLDDIIEAISRVFDYIKDLEYDQYLHDSKTQDAVVRNMEIIGEATKKLSSSFKDKHSQIPWKEMAGLRDRLIHDYFGVNYEILWTICKDELPKVKHYIDEIL